MFGRKSKNIAEISDEHSILRELENTLSTLSAYFTTTAWIDVIMSGQRSVEQSIRNWMLTTMRPPTA